MHFKDVFLVAACAGALTAACTSGSSCPNPGGPVVAAPDAHCGANVQTTSQASCHPDAGAADAGSGTGYGATLSNASGDDDDCKYHASWTSSPVCEQSSVIFRLTATNKTDGSPATGADVIVESFLGLTHPSLTPVVHTTEGPLGTYVTDPIRFDAPGEWTVRFHLFDGCDDTLADSPHGHIAFFVQVP